MNVLLFSNVFSLKANLVYSHLEASTATEAVEVNADDERDWEESDHPAQTLRPTREGHSAVARRFVENNVENDGNLKQYIKYRTQCKKLVSRVIFERVLKSFVRLTTIMTGVTPIQHNFQ